MNEFEYEETLKEYWKEGYEEGLAIGLKEALDDRLRKELEAFVCQVKQRGIKKDIIAKATGLTVEEIEAI